MTVLNALSFDVEDWFQVENLKKVISPDEWNHCEIRVIQNTRKVLRILERCQTRATFFVLGWVAARCEGLVKEISGAGHEIASHGYAHDLVYNMNPEDFREDISKSKTILESITGSPVLGYRAPSFSITSRSLWAPDILRSVGFHYDSSVFPSSFHNRYGSGFNSSHPFRHANGLPEIPLSTFKILGANFPLAGGAYFRLLPYFCFRYLCRQLNNRHRKALVFYLHPWELDPHQPRVDVNPTYHIRHYYNLEVTQRRLEKLLKEFHFVPLVDFAKHYFPEIVHYNRKTLLDCEAITQK